MKTTFRQRNSRSALGKKAAYALLAMAVGYITAFYLGAPLLSAVGALWERSGVVSKGLKELFAIVRDKDALARENLELKNELARLGDVSTALRAAEASRDGLLAEFGRTDTERGVAAGVLVHPPQTPYDVLILDAGETAGVQEGALVLLPSGGALGRITEAASGVSRASLFSSGGTETPAVLERGETPVTLQGAGGGTFKFSLPREAPVEAGDRLYLAGIRPELVAVVSDVSLAPTDSEKKVTARGLGSVYSVRFVIIR